MKRTYKIFGLMLTMSMSTAVVTKKHLLFFVCMILFLSSSNAFAQIKVDETCETKLSSTQWQLSKEREDKRAALDSIEALKISLKNMEENFIATKEELQAALSKVEHFSSISKESQELASSEIKKMKEDYEAQLQVIEKEKQQLQSDVQKSKEDMQKSKEDLREVEKRNLNLSTTISEVQRTFPFIVTDIQFQNINKKGVVINNYNANLSKINWLTFKIDYTGLMDEPKNITMRVKIFTPKGQLWYDKNISTTFTINAIDVVINPGSNNSITLNEWKHKKGISIFPSGKFDKGKYRMEIWHKDVCLGQKTFDIY